MIKTLKTMSKQDKERYTVPRKVQDVIPVRRIWQDGIFLTGNKFSKTYQFSDINYLVASREDKESMFLIYSELLNSLDSGAVTKITINNRRTNKANFENSILMPMQEDFRDEYRREYNQMLLDKATGANGITQEKYITISVVKKDIEEARAYFSRVGADLISHFAALGSKCVELDASERLRILHDFYRQGEEAEFSFDLAAMAKRGHDFKDYICPDSMEKNSDYVKLGDKFCRVLFLKDFASYIKDNMVTELITVSHKTAEEMANQFSFHEDQREQMAELLADENSSLWSQVLYGITGGDGEIVTVALSQVGNTGGAPYWSWYGFDSRVEWCACFVSWCANECGYIDAGVIPKFAACASQGVPWFKERGLWQDNSYEPRPGDIIFFDWDDGGQDGSSDHVGIVEKVENGRVYTVEGNSGDSVRQNSYPVGYYEIYGYGTPAY